MVDETIKANAVLPAGAGVIPDAPPIVSSALGFTRRRGGDPTFFLPVDSRKMFYPQARG